MFQRTRKFMVEGEEITFGIMGCAYLCEISIHPSLFIEWGQEKSWNILRWCDKHIETIEALLRGEEGDYDYRHISLDNLLTILTSPIVPIEEKSSIKKKYEESQRLH